MDKPTIHICTWIYADLPGEESFYPQVVGQSSSTRFLATYWRCLVIFFSSSLRHNPQARHVLFTNLPQVPQIDDFDTQAFFQRHGIELVTLPLTYRTPPGYHGAWRNQFYIFDILHYISQHNSNPDDRYLILDSDCVWIKPCDRIAQDLDRYGTLTYDLKLPPDYSMNGLSRRDMQQIFSEMDHTPVAEVPKYFGGEWFAATVAEISRLAAEAPAVWQQSLERFARGEAKFNEEAHTLSYLYHRLGYAPGTANPYIRQIWTAFRFRNASPEDFDLTVWHVPAEKMYGLRRLFRQVVDPQSRFWQLPLGPDFARYLSRYLSIPRRTPVKLLQDFLDYSIVWIRRRLS